MDFPSYIENRIHQKSISFQTLKCFPKSMMTSSNGNIFRVTGPLCGEFTGGFPSQKPMTRGFDVFFDLRLNKRLNKQSRGWWFETPLRSLWHHCNAFHHMIGKLWVSHNACIRIINIIPLYVKVLMMYGFCLWVSKIIWNWRTRLMFCPLP